MRCAEIFKEAVSQKTVETQKPSCYCDMEFFERGRTALAAWEERGRFFRGRLGEIYTEKKPEDLHYVPRGEDERPYNVRILIDGWFGPYAALRPRCSGPSAKIEKKHSKTTFAKENWKNPATVESFPGVLLEGVLLESRLSLSEEAGGVVHEKGLGLQEKDSHGAGGGGGSSGFCAVVGKEGVKKQFEEFLTPDDEARTKKPVAGATDAAKVVEKGPVSRRGTKWSWLDGTKWRGAKGCCIGDKSFE